MMHWLLALIAIVRASLLLRWPLRTWSWLRIWYMFLWLSVIGAAFVPRCGFGIQLLIIAALPCGIPEMNKGWRWYVKTLFYGVFGMYFIFKN